MIKKNDDEFTSKNLKESTYSKEKKDLLTINVNVEFSVIMNYIMDPKTLCNFYSKVLTKHNANCKLQTSFFKTGANK